jgi:Spy/CpxP family protein refolding chaperone
MRRFMAQAFVAAVIVAGLAVVIGAQPPSGAQGMHGQGMGQGPGRGQMGGMGMGPGRGGAMAALNLSTEQQAKVQAIMETARTEHQAVAEQLRAKHDALRDALFSEKPETAKPIADEIAALEAQMQPSRIEMQIAVVKVLTPEQRAKAKELDLFGRMGMGPMGPGRGGPGAGQRPPKK